MKYETIPQPLPDEIELLTFKLDAQTFAVDISSVLEIRKTAKLTTLPHAPPYMAGVSNLRGMILPVMDLKSRVGLSQTTQAETPMTIVIRDADQIAGLMVDAVLDILSVPRNSLQIAPETDEDLMPGFLSSIGIIEDEVIGIIDVTRILPRQQEAVQ